MTEPSKLFGQPRTTMAYSEIRAVTCTHRELVTLREHREHKQKQLNLTIADMCRSYEPLKVPWLSLVDIDWSFYLWGNMEIYIYIHIYTYITLIILSLYDLCLRMLTAYVY